MAAVTPSPPPSPPPGTLSDAAASTQEEVSAEIERIAQAYAGSGTVEDRVRLDYPPYRSSVLRHPTKDPHHADPEGIELWAPVFGERDVDPLEADLTIQHRGEPIGERLVVTGRVLDGEGRPVRHQLVEVWQANAGGRYIHKRDHRNAWRPAHIHFSVFGREFTQRLVTQMYFPGDPLFALDPIYQAITDQAARDRLVATYDHGVTTHEWSTGYRWDIVLTGSHRTPAEQDTAQSTEAHA